jgi:hypothetical protein
MWGYATDSTALAVTAASTAFPPRANASAAARVATLHGVAIAKRRPLDAHRPSPATGPPALVPRPGTGIIASFAHRSPSRRGAIRPSWTWSNQLSAWRQVAHRQRSSCRPRLGSEALLNDARLVKVGFPELADHLPVTEYEHAIT